MLYEEKWLLWVRPITGAGCPKSALTGGKTSLFDFFSCRTHLLLKFMQIKDFPLGAVHRFF